jgi:hypothetical protein
MSRTSCDRLLIACQAAETSLLHCPARNGTFRRPPLRGEQRASPSSVRFHTEQRKILAKLEAQPKALRADAGQACAAADLGRFVPREGGGNPDIDNAARIAGSLGAGPLVITRSPSSAGHGMAESPESIVIAVRQVVDELRANNNLTDLRAEAAKRVK